MSLYGDLPEEKIQPNPSSWQKFKSSKASKRGTQAVFGAPRQLIKKQKVQQEQRTKSDEIAVVGGFGLFSEMDIDGEEYDPAVPNEYEQVMKEREHKRAALSREADRLAKAKEQARLEKERATAATRSQESKVDKGFRKGMGLAESLLKKYGWQEGQGLGKAKQGIVAPLVLQKTDIRAGVIVESTAGNKQQQAQAQEQIPNSIEFPTPQNVNFGQHNHSIGTKTSVVVMKNMVGRGEVDESLGDEVGQECEKYGTVNDLQIFEATDISIQDSECVRIYVAMGTKEAAEKVLNALNGRYFGGRRVVAQFFDEERFKNKDLAPKPEDLAS